MKLVDAINPDNIATNFYLIKSLIEKHGINDPTTVFNLEESGFSIHILTLGRSKCLVRTD